MIWPFCPTDEYLEGLEFSSDVIRAYSAEQRIALTYIPRQRLNFSHIFSPRQYQRARMMMFSSAVADWTVPLWHENQSITCLIGATTLTVDTTTSDYRIGGEAILWADDETYESVTISNKSGSTLTVSATTRAYTGALVMPAITAKCIGGMDVSRSVEAYVNASVEFLAHDGEDLSNASLYSTTHRTYPVIDDPAVIGAGSISERVQLPYDEVDNGIAGPSFDAQQSAPAQSFALGWVTTTQTALWALRQFAHYLRGKQGAFWVPEWTTGLSVQANITSAGTTITVLAVGLNTNYETGDIMVRTTAGVLHYFRFTSVAVSGANEVLTLSAAAGVNISTSDIERACLIHLCRLAQDRIEFVHSNPRRATVLVSCDEVPIP